MDTPPPKKKPSLGGNSKSGEASIFLFILAVYKHLLWSYLNTYHKSGPFPEVVAKKPEETLDKTAGVGWEKQQNAHACSNLLYSIPFPNDNLHASSMIV